LVNSPDQSEEVFYLSIEEGGIRKRLFTTFTITGLFDIHEEPNCSAVVSRGIHQMLSAVWVVKELNKQNFIPGVTLGKCYESASSLNKT
jgi:hypothetical protein